MHNIEEGFDSETNAECLRFLRYAKRSCSDVRSQSFVTLDQKYISKTEFDDIFNHAD
jgi:four helix bundle protein